MIPTVPVGSDSTCDAACVPAWTGYWCQLSCVAFNVNKTSMCRSAAQSMFSSCSSCSSLKQYFKGASTVDEWAAAFGYQLADYTPCMDFTRGTPAAETAKPVLVLGVPTAEAVITSNTAITLTVSATSKSAPSSSVFRVVLGAQNLLTVRAGATKWSSNGADSWLFSMTIQLSNLAPSGTYKLVAVVRNGAGETTAEATFAVRTVVTATSIANWELCSAGTGVDGSVVPDTVTEIENLNCCGATCDLAAATGRSVTLTTFTLRGQATLRSFVMSLRGAFKLEASATALTLLSTMSLQFLQTATMIVQQNLLITTDSTSRVWFRRGSTFAVRGSRRMLNCAGRSFSETSVQVDSGARLQVSGANGNFVTNGSLAVAGDVEANTTSNTADAIELRDGTAVTGAGRFKVGKGRAILRKVVVETKIILKPFVTLVSAGAKINVQALQAQAPMCGTQAGNVTVDTQTAALVQLAPSCVAMSGEPVVANSISALTVLSGGGLKLSGASNNSGVLKVDTLDLQAGSIVEVEFVAGIEGMLSAEDVTIPVLKYSSATQGCPDTASVTVGSGALQRATTVICANNTVFVKFAGNATMPPPVAAPAADALAFTSDRNYSLVLNKDCASFPNTSFVNTIATTRNIPAATIIVLSYQCGSITAVFKCRGASVSAADATCTSITAEANRAGSALNTALGVQTATPRDAPVSSSDESNEGLYALFALLLIPICCIVGAIMYKRKTANADQQFAADTLTFSSVAVPKKGTEMGAFDPYAAQYPVSYPVPSADGYSESYVNSSAYGGTTYSQAFY